MSCAMLPAMIRLSLVILCCCLSACLYGQQTVGLPIIVDFGDQATALTISDVKVEVNRQPVAVESITPLAGQHLQYALINAERQKTLWPGGAKQQIDVASQFLKQVVVAGFDIGSLVNFSVESYLDVSDQKDPRQLAAKLLANDGSGAAMYDALAMYDAVVATASHLADKPAIPGYRKAIFLFCDGEDNQSTLTLTGATVLLQRLGIPLFVVAPSSVKNKTQGKNLSKLAREAGGRAYFLRDDAREVNFDFLKHDLAHSFLLKINVSLSQTMAGVTITAASQPKIPIIAPSRIGLPPSDKPNPSTNAARLDKTPRYTRYTKEQLAELYAKCSPYTTTKVEDLESKRVPLPPHECAGVLGWMRDSRVEKLYTPEKSPQ